MVPVRVSRLAIDGTAGTNVVVLQEIGGERILPIWIGRAEADAIARFLEGVSSARPLTHDLARDLVEALDGTVRQLMITHVQDNTFFAEIVVHRGETRIVVDARPSDAIALALRFGAELYAADALLAHYPESRDDGSSAEREAAADEPGIPRGGEGSAAAEAATERDEGEYQSPSATGTSEPSDLQKYLERLRPEDFGKFRP